MRRNILHNHSYPFPPDSNPAPRADLRTIPLNEETLLSVSCSISLRLLQFFSLTSLARLSFHKHTVLEMPYHWAAEKLIDNEAEKVDLVKKMLGTDNTSEALRWCIRAAWATHGDKIKEIVAGLNFNAVHTYRGKSSFLENGVSVWVLFRDSALKVQSIDTDAPDADAGKGGKEGRS